MANHENREHAILSASGASRWLNCTPSIRLEEHFEKEDSIYAAEGTLAHEFSEIMLKKRLGLLSEEEYNLKMIAIKSSTLYSSEMDGFVESYVFYVLETFAIAKEEDPGAIILIELRIDLTEYIPFGFGTCDIIILANKTAQVIDLKYGRGIEVSALNNSQLKLYGLGAIRANDLSFEIEEVILTIVQPRLYIIESFEISAGELEEWGKNEVKPKADLAFKGEGVTKPGSWCIWCAAKPKCKALANYNLSLAKMEFQEPNLLTDEELLEVYSKSDALKDWTESVKEYVFKEAIKGKKWEGFKLVEGRSSRAWIDEDSVIDALIIEGFSMDSIINGKLRGIGDISNLMSVDKFNKVLGKLIAKPKGKPSLVPLSDKRKLYENSSAEDDFSS